MLGTSSEKFTYYSLLTTLQLSTYYLLITSHYLILTTYILLLTTYYLLLTTYSSYPLQEELLQRRAWHPSHLQGRGDAASTETATVWLKPVNQALAPTCYSLPTALPAPHHSSLIIITHHWPATGFIITHDWSALSGSEAFPTCKEGSRPHLPCKEGSLPHLPCMGREPFSPIRTT